MTDNKPDRLSTNEAPANSEDVDDFIDDKNVVDHFTHLTIGYTPPGGFRQLGKDTFGHLHQEREGNCRRSHRLLPDATTRTANDMDEFVREYPIDEG